MDSYFDEWFSFFFPIFTWHACIIHTHIEVIHLSQPSYILIQLNLNLLLASFHANILIKYFKVTSLGNFLWLHPNCDNLKYIALEKKKISYQLKRHAKHHKTYNFLASTLIKAHGRHHQYHSLTLSTYGRLNILIEQSINILIKTPQIWLPVVLCYGKMDIYGTNEYSDFYSQRRHEFGSFFHFPTLE